MQNLVLAAGSCKQFIFRNISSGAMIELKENTLFSINILIYRERATSCTRGWFLCLSDGRCLEKNLLLEICNPLQ